MSTHTPKITAVALWAFLLGAWVTLTVINTRALGDHRERIKALTKWCQDESDSRAALERVPRRWALEEHLGIPAADQPPRTNAELERLIRTSTSATLDSQNSLTIWADSKLLEFFPLKTEGRPSQIEPEIPVADRGPHYRLTLSFYDDGGGIETLSISSGRVSEIAGRGLRGMPLSYLRRRLREAGPPSMQPPKQ